MVVRCAFACIVPNADHSRRMPGHRATAGPAEGGQEVPDDANQSIRKVEHNEGRAPGGGP